MLATALLASAHSYAAQLSVEIRGLEAEMLEAAHASLDLARYEQRDVSQAQVRRAFVLAETQIRDALEPFGYYRAHVASALEQPREGVFRATFQVTPGDPVTVRDVHIEVGAAPRQIEEVQRAIAQFELQQGDRLDHESYERSKRRIATALAGAGFLDAELARHRVEVSRSANAAEIDLVWQPGERHRFGAVQFSGAQFPERFLQGFVPWRPGEFYSTEQLLELQRRLADTDYFSSVAVTPDLLDAAGSVVPVDALLVPAKRTAYSASLYVRTDSGVGGRIGADWRWLNMSGHKLSAEAEYATRRQEVSAQYRIPRPGPRTRNLSFGAAYGEETTDSSISRMLRIASIEGTKQWKGFNRSLGLHYLNGDFEIADARGSTNLLYAEGLLTRRHADDLYFAGTGYSVLFGLRLAADALRSDTSLAQVRADAIWLQRVGENGRIVLRTAYGAMAVDDFDALPPELRFFAGGDRSIRGFDYQQIGATDTQGRVIGGEFLAVGSLEYEHYFLQKWGAAVFVDAGDAFTSRFHANVGVGFGLRWKSPVGPVRIDVARPVGSDFSNTWRVHLVIGPDL